MAVDPASILMYARLASEAAELVSNLTDSAEKERQGKKPSKAELDKIERKRERVNQMWKELGPDANVIAPKQFQNNNTGGSDDSDTSS